jgi:hypothetical protein
MNLTTGIRLCIIFLYNYTYVPVVYKDGSKGCTSITSIAFLPGTGSSDTKLHIISNYAGDQYSDCTAVAVISEVPSSFTVQPDATQDYNVCWLFSSELSGAAFSAVQCSSDGQFVAASNSSGVSLWRRTWGESLFQFYRIIGIDGAAVSALHFTTDNTSSCLHKPKDDCTKQCRTTACTALQVLLRDSSTLCTYDIATGVQVCRAVELSGSSEGVRLACFAENSDLVLTASGWLPLAHVFSMAKLKSCTKAILNKDAVAAVEAKSKRSSTATKHERAHKQADKYTAALQPFLGADGLCTNAVVQLVQSITESDMTAVEALLDPAKGTDEGTHIRCNY